MIVTAKACALFEMPINKIGSVCNVKLEPPMDGFCVLNKINFYLVLRVIMNDDMKTVEAFMEERPLKVLA